MVSTIYSKIFMVLEVHGQKQTQTNIGLPKNAFFYPQTRLNLLARAPTPPKKPPTTYGTLFFSQKHRRAALHYIKKKKGVKKPIEQHTPTHPYL